MTQNNIDLTDLTEVIREELDLGGDAESVTTTVREWLARTAAQPATSNATISALVRALEKHYGKGKKWPLPSIPIGTRVRVHDTGAAGIGTVVGRDGYGFDGVSIIFDEPAPRGFEDGCCAGVEQCEVLADTHVIPPGVS